jgi:NAD(P)-dependent dehydrogenase (short-subunit alcohol dehydrogenase family)
VTQPAAPQLVIATDISKPPGVTMCRNGAWAAIASIAASSARSRFLAKPRNTVAPGAIDTVRDWSQYTHQQREQLEKEIPLGRYGTTDELAAACDLLCGDRGGFISGQVIHVNGGHYMY